MATSRARTSPHPAADALLRAVPPAAGARLLHLGCFDRAIEGWVNTDVSPHTLIARVPGAAWVLRRLGRMTAERFEQHQRGVFAGVRHLDLTKRFRFENDTFDAAFSAHVFEHLYKRDAERCAAEVHRVLRPGGVFRVTVPDLHDAICNYDPKRPEVLLQLIYENTQPRDKNRHHWMYNEHSMRALLVAAGFSKVLRCAYREGTCPDIDRLDNRPVGTLFMEAFK
jgi:SAM-dependent methyltransferase